MGNEVLVVVEQLGGKIAEISFELLGKGKELAHDMGATLAAAVAGNGIRSLTDELGIADCVLVTDDSRFAHYNPELLKRCLVELVQSRSPKVVLIGNTAFGMDLAAGLSAETNIPLLAYCKELYVENGHVVAVSELYGGKILVESEAGETPLVVSVLAGAFPAAAGKKTGTPWMEEFSLPEVAEAKITFKRLIQPDAGDVDITKEAFLVSVGRGIGSKDNIALVEELAKALGAALSASRPIVDNGWLPKTRQVGKSGMTVKPQVYLAVGISGAPEHIEGMRDAELIVAINSDPTAPIFNIAHYGIVGDLFDLIPVISEKVKAARSS
jgi:electron transfer flavoprotein alpha subunit